MYYSKFVSCTALLSHIILICFVQFVHLTSSWELGSAMGQLLSLYPCLMCNGT